MSQNLIMKSRISIDIAYPYIFVSKTIYAE